MRDDSIAPVHLRLGKLFTPIENWRRLQPRIPTRSDAIKELLKIALEAERQRVEQHTEQPGGKRAEASA
jgi:hypothetical protein